MTAQQELHRAYLNSPLWQTIRAKAFAHYGHVCSRCGKEGHDVHHKTYFRTGGNEIVEDLEVLCRPCHEAHHAAERTARFVCRQRKRRAINGGAAFRLLTRTQRKQICSALNLSENDLYLKLILMERSPAHEMTECLLGVGIARVAVQDLSGNTPYADMVAARAEITRQLAVFGVSEAWARLQSMKRLRKVLKAAQNQQPIMQLVGKRALQSNNIPKLSGNTAITPQPYRK